MQVASATFILYILHIILEQKYHQVVSNGELSMKTFIIVMFSLKAYPLQLLDGFIAPNSIIYMYTPFSTPYFAYSISYYLMVNMKMEKMCSIILKEFNNVEAKKQINME